jgi:L-amino acid N-acyltransferase YncA
MNLPISLSMVRIRPATVEDAGGIAHVHVQSWLTTYAGIVPQAYLSSLNEAERALSWREWLTRGVHAYLAESEGEIVGFVSGGQIREVLHDYDAELFAIYLLKGAQRSGIGKALLRELANSLGAKGFKSMIAWCLQSNPSVDFYRKTGALPISTKEIEIGGTHLTELAFGWPNLSLLCG